MIIRDIEVERFGALRDLRITDLPPGLSVFEGRNEAGKSTLLEFLRTMLCGPAVNPGPRERSLLASGEGGNAGSTAGGQLTLATERYGLVRLERNPAGGPPVLYRLQGDHGPSGAVSGREPLGQEALPQGVLSMLLGGLNRELYAGVCGIGLGELQGLAAGSPAVREALSGSTFGAGLRAPGVVLAEFDAVMDQLYGAEGQNRPLRESLRQWDRLEAEILAARTALDEYNAADEAAGRLEQRLAELEARQEELERERRVLDRRLEVWERWEAWRLCCRQLSHLPEFSLDMPMDAVRRLEQLQARFEESQRQSVQARQAVQSTRATLAAVGADHELAAVFPVLRELGERKASCRNALAALPRLHDELAHNAEALRETLAMLGPQWSVERILTVNRTLHGRELLNQRADELSLSESACTSAGDHLVRVRLAGEEAARAEREASLYLEQLPAPVSNLAETARDELRARLSALEDGRRRLTRCENELKNARMEQQRAIAPLHLLPGNTTVEGLQRIAAARDDSLELARKAVEAQRTAQDAKEVANRARDAEEACRRRFARLRERKDDLGDPSRTALDNRRLALRHLRRAADLFPVEEYNLREAEDALALHMADAPSPDRNPWLMGLGFVLALAGVGHMAAMRLMDMDALALGGDTLLPLIPFHGYLVLLAGLTFMAAGLPRKNPDAERHALKTGQLRSRVHSAQENVTQLKEDLARLCAAAGADSSEPGRLDALEAELERAQEQCATNERLEEELGVHQRELDDLQSEARQQAQNQQRMAGESAAAQRRWHDRLEEFGVRNVMHTPDSAENFFARVDMALSGVAVVNRIHEELRELEGNAPALSEAARLYLPAEAVTGPWTDTSVETAVRGVLEACRQADLAAEERARAAQSLELSRERMTREAGAETQAATQVARLETELQAARERWSDALASLGLAEDKGNDGGCTELSPSTARQALQCMDTACALDAERRRLNEEIQRQTAERDALLEPLREQLDRFASRLMLNSNPVAASGESGDPQSQRDETPLLSLDALLRIAEQATRAVEEEQRLASRIEEQERALTTADEVESEARRRLDELLLVCEAADGDALLRRCALRDERNGLAREAESLRDLLWLAGQKIHDETHASAEHPESRPPFDDAHFNAFAESFAGQSRDDLELRLLHVAEENTAIAAEREREAQDLRGRQLVMETLRSTDRLTFLRREQENCAARARSLAVDWARQALARQMLAEARSRFERDSQPAVIRLASTLFADLTCGRWSGVHRSLDDDSLRALSPQGDPTPVELLSRGTAEQLYLALRLAHARLHAHAATATPLPLILDDVLVNFDPQRAEQAVITLGKFACDSEQGAGHQILFFTCHPHMSEIIRRSVPDAAHYSL